MTQDPALVTPGMQFVLATRHLERIADHATNIAEDIIFWVRGLDVRHGRGLTMLPETEQDQTVRVTSNEDAEGGTEKVTENSSALHAGVRPGCETQRA